METQSQLFEYLRPPHYPSNVGQHPLPLRLYYESESDPTFTPSVFFYHFIKHLLVKNSHTNTEKFKPLQNSGKNS